MINIAKSNKFFPKYILKEEKNNPSPIIGNVSVFGIVLLLTSVYEAIIEPAIATENDMICIMELQMALLHHAS